MKAKIARFKLAPDGFSIHTFELSQKLTKGEYRNIKSSLYTKAKTDGGTMYKAEDGTHVCGLFSNHGVRLSLHHNHQSEYSSHLIKMVINPRKLIDSECLYLGILEPEKSRIKQLSKAFTALFKGTDIENDIDAHYISRLDFCTNIHCDSGKIFRELVRVLRKLPTPAKYKHILKTADLKAKNQKKVKKEKKEANLYNKHYIKFACGTHVLVIYDKSYQIKHEGLDVGYEKLPYSILRFEVHCERAYIRKLETKLTSDTTTDLLWSCVKNSQKIITSHFTQCWGEMSVFQLEELETIIQKSRYPDKIQKQQMELVSHLRRKQSVDKAFAAMKLSDSEEKKRLLDTFKKMRISPIPLTQNFCANMLFGPVALLEQIGTSTLSVEYRKAKRK